MDWNVLLDASRQLAPLIASFIAKSIAALAGVWFVMAGLVRMANRSRPGFSGNPGLAPVMGNLFIGAIFLQFSRTVDVLSETVFGSSGNYSASAAMAYVPAPLKEAELMEMAIEVVLIWVIILGIVSIFRGLLIANTLAEGKGQSNKSGWSVFWHIVGGVALVNIAKTLEIITSYS